LGRVSNVFNMQVRQRQK